MPYQRRPKVADDALRRSKPRIIDWASETQRQAFMHGPQPMVCSGGFGASKTFACCLKAIWLSDQYPNNRGVIARKVYRELQKTTIPTFYKVLDNPAAWSFGGKRSDSEGYLVFNNGSRIDFIHLAQDDIMGILRGLEINWFFVDQAEAIDEEIFTTLMRRLGRWDRALVPDNVLIDWYKNKLIAYCKQEGFSPLGTKAFIKDHLTLDRARSLWDYKNPQTGDLYPPPYAMLACNPAEEGEDHWIYKKFHPEAPDHSLKHIKQVDYRTGLPSEDLVSYKDLGYKMFQMNTLDNKFLTNEYKQQLLADHPDNIDKYVHGKWGRSEASIHQVDDLSIVDGTQDLLSYFLQWGKLHITGDHGDSSPTCALFWVVDINGNSICLGEYYQPNLLISEHRENIAYLRESVFVGKAATLLMDPSIFHKTMQRGVRYGKSERYSVSDEYADCTNYPRRTALWWRPADNDEMGTRNRINEYLRSDPDRVHPIHRTKGSPRLLFLRQTEDYPHGCNQAIRQLKAQKRIKIGMEMGRDRYSEERDDKVTDHAYDCIRYHVASRPRLHRIDEKRKEYGTFEWARKRARRIAEGPADYTHVYANPKNRSRRIH